MSVKITMKYAAPFIVALAPFTALAAEGDLSAAQEACVENCVNGTTASAQPTKAKKAKKSTTVATAPAPVSTTTTTSPDQAMIDSIRAEERARAAEEFNAGQQQAMQSHQEHLDRAKAEERAKVETEAQQKLAAERLRYEQALAAERTKGDGEVVEDALITPAGVYGFVGGGVSNFTQPEAAGATAPGGYWDARVGVGTRSVLGAEVAYVGSARDIAALGLANDAALISHGVEGVARLNVPITPENTTVLIEPYTFGGVGWNRYNIFSNSPNTSSIDDVDNVMTVPVGVGMAFGFSGVTLDTRATYRHALGSELMGSSTSSFDSASLNSWGLGAALGFEF